MNNLTADEILNALGVEVNTVKPPIRNGFEERVLTGFEDIQRFFRENNRLPRNEDGLDIFERIYSVRLEQIRKNPEALAILKSSGATGLIEDAPYESNSNSLNPDELLKKLEIEIAAKSVDDITELKHVRKSLDRNAPIKVASQSKCMDFKKFKTLFDEVEIKLKSGKLDAVRFGKDVDIQQNDIFILNGQFVYIASIDKKIKIKSGHDDARLRVIFSNGTESNLLSRSLKKALWKDSSGMRILKKNFQRIFSEFEDSEDVHTGSIYVLRSNSTENHIKKNRHLIHKIGVTSGTVESRIAGAKNDPTYLMADVEVVREFKLSNINPIKMEGIFKKIFSDAQIDITISDRFGNPVKPKEWFLVPIDVIDEAVDCILDGSISQMVYDASIASLVRMPFGK